jgi:hypothetical protein
MMSPKFLIALGILTVIIGLIWQFWGQFPLGKLPGDISIKRDNMEFYFPVMSSIVLSVILSLVAYFLRK